MKGYQTATAGDGPTIEGVIAAERRRGEALVAGDLAALRDILAPELTHTHTRGVTDDLPAFLHFVEHDMAFLEIERGPLTVRLFGDVAVMTGTSTNLVKPRDKEPILSRSQALQVWQWRSRRWVMLAFQSTTLPSQTADPFSSYIRLGGAA
jgi:hypothetical protein